MTNRIQKKIWLLATVVIGIMAAIWIALTYYNQKTLDQYNEILQRYLSMNDASVVSQRLVAQLNNYLLTPSSNQIQQLQSSKEVLRDAKYKLYSLRNTDNDFELSSYVNLIDSLVETVDRSLLFHTEKDTEASNNAFSESTRISQYISEMALTLMDKELNTYDQFYRDMNEQSEALRTFGFWLILLISFLLALFTYWFSLSITRPVYKLIQAAKEISRGRFDQQIEVSSNDEISFLAKMFDRMRVNINNLILEMKEKAELEKELQHNKLLLKESQLLSLQSQINPHFLFNTLDTLSKKAYLEGAEETSDLLVTVADLLRYNLKRIDRSVTLLHEVQVLQHYIEIQKARFSERLRFEASIDESCLNVPIPGLTLQPIVENAVVHAVEPREEGGTIRLRIMDGPDLVTIEIEDDGDGISEEIIERILNEEPIETRSHSTGIGFTNVVRRLRLFYGVQDVMEISSSCGSGTRIALKIPKKRGSDTYV